ncbi:hypothetical protein [Methanobrevibacter arboriphilus]|nr:hypothetical protein [Methanobrevibacter arboriphilus]
MLLGFKISFTILIQFFGKLVKLFVKKRFSQSGSSVPQTYSQS